MRSLSIAVALLIPVFFLGCGSSQKAAEFKAGTPEYDLAASLSKTIPVLNPDENQVLASTSHFKIRTSDLCTALCQSLGQRVQQMKVLPPERMKEIIRQNTERLIEKRLVLREAKKKGIKVSPAQIDSVIQRQYNAFGGRDPFLAYLKQNDLVFENIEKELQEGMIIDTYVDVVVGKGVEVTDAEMNNAYEEYRQKSQTATVRHILILTEGKSDSEKKSAHRKIQDLLSRAKRGENFAALAVRYSEDPGSSANGGLYEDFARGEMVEPFEEAAFSVPVGDISDIVETQYGYHILKVEERKSGARPLEEVRQELAAALLESKKKAAYQKALQALKENAHFQIVEF